MLDILSIHFFKRLVVDRDGQTSGQPGPLDTVRKTGPGHVSQWARFSI